MKYIFDSGGIIMYILLFSSIISLAVILEKFYYYFRYEKLKKSFDYLTFVKENHNPKNSLETLIKILVEENKKSNKLNHFHLEEKAREFTLEKMLKFEDKLWLLALISNISPLLGLFGTVTGMISAFNVIAVAGTGDPKLLAAGISKALITTAGGLSVAMPTAVFLNYFSKKSEELITQMEKITVEFLNNIRSDENGI